MLVYRAPFNFRGVGPDVPPPALIFDDTFPYTAGNLTGKGLWIDAPTGDGATTLRVAGAGSVVSQGPGDNENIVPLASMDVHAPYSFTVGFFISNINTGPKLTMQIEDTVSGVGVLFWEFDLASANQLSGAIPSFGPVACLWGHAHVIRIDFDGTTQSCFLDNVLVHTDVQSTPSLTIPAVSIAIAPVSTGLTISHVRFEQP